jgi:DNA repair protein RadC
MIAKPHDKRIKEMEVRARLHKRMAERDAEALRNQELLVILVGSGNKERSATTISGLGSAKVTIIISALELRLCRLPAKRRQIRTLSDVYPLTRHYSSRIQEHFRLHLEFLYSRHPCDLVIRISVDFSACIPYYLGK